MHDILAVFPNFNRRSWRFLTNFQPMRRRWAAAEALELGHGGISAVFRATALTPRTIRHGINELAIQGDGSGDDALPKGKQRKPGGGRKKLSAK